MTYVVHIVAGTLGLLLGYVALYSVKGARLHRKTGRVFVYAMLTTSVLGVIIAAARSVAPAINIPAALLTCYLLITSLTTVRPLATGTQWLNIGALLVALAVGLVSLAFGFEALANGGTRKGMPAFPFFMFAVIGLLASAGDVRVIRSGALRGAPRLARHLWRMCIALFMAGLSFFPRQSQWIPEPLRMPAIALPLLAVLVTMVYWLWRVRWDKKVSGIRHQTSAIGHQSSVLSHRSSVQRHEIMDLGPRTQQEVGGEKRLALERLIPDS